MEQVVERGQQGLGGRPLTSGRGRGRSAGGLEVVVLDHALLFHTQPLLDVRRGHRHLVFGVFARVVGVGVHFLLAQEVVFGEPARALAVGPADPIQHADRLRIGPCDQKEARTLCGAQGRASAPMPASSQERAIGRFAPGSTNIESTPQMSDGTAQAPANHRQERSSAPSMTHARPAVPIVPTIHHLFRWTCMCVARVRFRAGKT